MPPDFLTRTERLVDLHLDKCKIRTVLPSTFAHLHHLKSLTITTHNADWSPMTMELHSESFAGLDNLRKLNLSRNNIWTLPQGVFCPLHSLKTLNLTHNRIQNTTQLGLSLIKCNNALEILDLSNNDIITVPDDVFSAQRSLTVLHLQENAISSISDRSLQGLTSLQILNLSSNYITTLPPDLFQSSKDIKEVYVRNNSLNVLAPGVFEGLNQLLVLDLSHNELTSKWVKKDTFVGLVRMVVLNLAHNSLSKIDSTIFRDLYSLQNLNLEGNRIEILAEDAFSELKNLHALILSHNNLKVILAHHFSGLYVLNQLFLDHNNLNSVHARAFENVTNLQDLSMSGNDLRGVPQAIKNLRVLKSLDLGKNNISVIVNASFEGLDQLYGLRLVDNSIVSITAESFVNLPSLQVLNLASNEIRTISRAAFSSNKNLRAIRLDGNKLADISGLFSNVKYLGWLNLSDNNIAAFDYDDLPNDLEWLDIYKNKIKQLPRCAHTKSVNLKTLDASFNMLSEISDSVVPNTIEKLYVNNNNITQVEPGTFVEKPNLQKVVLYANNIQTMDIGALALSPVADGAEVAQFYISENPYKCDCTMEWLQRINQLVHTRQHPRVMDLEKVSCSLTHARGTATKPVLEMKPSQFLCPYDSHCFALCHCCEFDACDCEMTCPSNCSCYHDVTWTANVVDCSNAGYTEVPAKIPMDATEIYLDGNNLKELGSHVFIGKKKLQVLYLNNSNLHNVHNRTFKGVESLKVLHLESNKLQELRGDEFDQLHNLNELYLDHNGITSVGNDTFKAMKNLEVLRLDENKIVNFSPWQLLASSSGSLSHVSLEGNKWSCDCRNIVKLESWLRSNPGDPEKMFCSHSDKNRDRETIASVLSRCSNYMDNRLATSVEQREVFFTPTFIGQNYISIFAGTFIAIVVVCMCAALVFAFRQDVRLWAHSKYGVRLFKNNTTTNIAELDADRLYDAYMIYSIKDEDFVTRAISSELERAGYSVCLHYRDIHMMTGNSYLSDSVSSTAEASKRIIVVLTINFLTLEWLNHDLRTSVLSTLKGLRLASKNNKIIFVLTTDVSALNLDSDLQLYLRSHSAFYWGEKRFWEKLRFAMPDVHADEKKAVSSAQSLKSLPSEIPRKSPSLSGPCPEGCHPHPRQHRTLPAPVMARSGSRAGCTVAGPPRSCEVEGSSSCSYNHPRELGYPHRGRTYFV